MYAVTASCIRRSHSAAVSAVGSGGAAAWPACVRPRWATARASSRSCSATSSRQVYGERWTCFRYQS